jgi:hypothetical protein
MAGIKEPRAIAAKPPDDPIKKAYHYIITCLILHIFAIVSMNFPSPPEHPVCQKILTILTPGII